MKFVLSLSERVDVLSEEEGLIEENESLKGSGEGSGKLRKALRHFFNL